MLVPKTSNIRQGGGEMKDRGECSPSSPPLPTSNKEIEMNYDSEASRVREGEEM